MSDLATKSITLCVLVVAAACCIAVLTGAGVERLVKLFLNGLKKEFISPMGWLCMALGLLMAALMMSTVLAPDIIGIYARMVDPAHFSEPSSNGPLFIMLFFGYCLLNVWMVGVYNKRR